MDAGDLTYASAGHTMEECTAACMADPLCMQVVFSQSNGACYPMSGAESVDDSTVDNHVCPASHPFVYHSGSHCCKYDTDYHGNALTYTSGACKDHAFITCPAGNADLNCKPRCPASHPFTYHSGSHCCKYDTDYHGNPLTYLSGACKDHALITCPAGASDHNCQVNGYEWTSAHCNHAASAVSKQVVVANSAPTCEVDATGTTHVYYKLAIHPSFKCTHTGSTCTCAQHPTHHAGGCMQMEGKRPDSSSRLLTMGGNCADVTHIVEAGDDFFGVGTDMCVYRRPRDGAGSWVKLTGDSVTQIAVVGDDIFGVGTDLSVYRHARDGTGSWVQVTSGSVTQIAVDGDDIFGVGTDLRVHRHARDGTGSWVQVTNGSVTQIAVVGDDIFGVSLATTSAGDHCVYKHARDGAGSWVKAKGEHLKWECPADDCNIDGASC
jgi:hypothetical protein